MSDPSNVAKSLRDRIGGNTEDRLGKALSDLLESPLLTSAIGRAFDAREKASQAQEVALGALNIPSAADIERLTRRLRAVSHRLESIEDGVDRLDRALTPSGVDARLSAIETQLRLLTEKLERALERGESNAAVGEAEPHASSSGAKRTPASKARGATGAGKGARRAAPGRSAVG